MYIGSNFKSIMKGTTKMTKKQYSFDKQIQLNSVDNLTLFIKELSWWIISTFICWKTCYCAHLFTGNTPGVFEWHYMYCMCKIIITKQKKRNKLYRADLRWHKKQQFFVIPYLFDYKPISAISRDPKLWTCRVTGGPDVVCVTEWIY